VAFFVLVKGSVRVFYEAPDGRQVVVKLFQTPAIFGEMECIAGLHYLESVETLEKATVLRVPQKAFLEALRSSHTFSNNVLFDLSVRLCIAARSERMLAFDPVEQRLASLLTSYVELYGLPVYEGTKIRIPLSQETLAQSIGANRRSVVRTLEKWAEDALLTKQGKHYIVRDVQKLQAMVDPTALGVAHRTNRALRPKR
jgi:CRP-like cAMP-binding protein